MKELFITVLSTDISKGPTTPGISNVISFIIFPTIFGFYNILYYSDYVSISHNILLVTGFHLLRDTGKLTQIISLPYLILLNSLSRGSSSDQNRARMKTRETSSLLSSPFSNNWVWLYYFWFFIWNFCLAPYMNAFTWSYLFHCEWKKITSRWYRRTT